MLGTVRKLVFVATRDQLPRYLALLLAMLVAALLEAISVGAVLPFLGAVTRPEAVIANPHVRRIIDAFGIALDATHLLLLVGAVMIVVFTLKGCVVVLSTWYQARVLHQQRASLSRTLFSHYLRLPYALFLHKNTAHVIHVISGVTAHFATAFMAAILTLLSELMVCATIVLLLFLVSPGVTGLAVLFMLVVGGGYIWWSKPRLSRISRQQHDATLALNKSVLEGLDSSKETRVIGAEDYFLRRFDRLTRAYMRSSVQLNVLGQAPRVVAETLFVLVVVVALMLLAAGGRDLKADAPLIALFGMAFVRLLPSFNRMVNSFTGARVHLLSLDILFQELNEVGGPSSAMPADGRRASSGERLRLSLALTLKDVCFSYTNDATNALDGVSLEIRKGEIVGLVGRSGAGKTTLVDVILGLLRPQKGDILADGVSILDRPEAWHGTVGYIPQAIYLTDDTIRRNIAFGVEDEEIDEAAVRRTVTAAQLSDLISTLPGGLDTVVGERGTRLSGGQRQRIAIARALYRDPELLILDEATSALDVETESALNAALRDIVRSKTLIVIAHRLTTVKDCDRLYLIDQGRVADSGSYDELLQRNAWFRRINELLA